MTNLLEDRFAAQQVATVTRNESPLAYGNGNVKRTPLQTRQSTSAGQCRGTLMMLGFLDTAAVGLSDGRPSSSNIDGIVHATLCAASSHANGPGG